MKILLSEDGKKFIYAGKDVHTHLGIVKKEDIEKGGVVRSHLGKKFFVFDATFPDLFEKIKRGPQIITLKDCALIAAFTGVESGWICVDLGVGSGALMCFLAHLVKPNGKVIGYEIDERWMKLAMENAKLLGVKRWIEIKQKDAYAGIDEKDVDLITIDLPEPWKCMQSCYDALKYGRFCVCYLPTIEQVKRLLEQKGKFRVEKIVECLVREWKEKPLRPLNVGLVHTGFLIFLRKV